MAYGLHVKLAQGWKTYWRVPGEAGIPPTIKLEGPDVEGLDIAYPLPQRLVDDSGEAIGYHDEVVFILRPKWKADAKLGPLNAKVSAFFGVCQNICRPAKFAGELSTAVVDDAIMQKFSNLLPQAVEFVNKAAQNDATLTLTLGQVVQEIFVVGPAGTYFHKPTFGMGEARFKIDGLTDGQKLSGKDLDIVAVADGAGLEQTVTVA